MNRTFLRPGLAALLPLALSGCVAVAPHTEANLGHAMTDLKNAQTLNPGARADARNPNGVAGSTAHSSYQAYEKSYKSPEPQSNAFTIGVGK